MEYNGQLHPLTQLKSPRIHMFKTMYTQTILDVVMGFESQPFCLRNK